MESTTYILVSEFCSHHHLEIGFVQRLQDRGVVEIFHREEGDSIPLAAMHQLEKMVRLHQELEIHPDDLDVVSDLLDRLESMKEELKDMKERLHFFEQHFEEL
jgi:hypothetical protein